MMAKIWFSPWTGIALSIAAIVTSCLPPRQFGDPFFAALGGFLLCKAIGIKCGTERKEERR